MPGPITPLIICGGSGTRLWPVSRESLPKQFLPLIGEHSTFQQAVLRVSDDGLFAPPVIITHRDYRPLAAHQLRALKMEAQMLFEPERRGSGPAILAGALWAAASRGDDAPVLALAADHIIRDSDGFHQACRAALPPAETGAIVTFGIVPDHPATGYGYIEAGEKLHEAAYAVRRFVEKPDAEKAMRYMSEGYLWNSGNFLFHPRSLIAEYRQHDDETLAVVDEAVRKAGSSPGAAYLDENAFGRAVSRSIDYAVMEKTVHAAVVPASHDWCDIGSWSAIHALLSKEQATAGQNTATRSLTVRAGETLTLPGHLLHAEYWIVAGGAGTATIAGEARILGATEFIGISAGADRRIMNEGESDLRIVTVRIDTLGLDH